MKGYKDKLDSIDEIRDIDLNLKSFGKCEITLP